MLVYKHTCAYTCDVPSCSEQFGGVGGGSDGHREKARSLCASLPAQLLRHLQNKGEHNFQKGTLTSNSVIPLIERTCAGLLRSVSVRKQKFSRSPRTCKPPCVAKL